MLMTKQRAWTRHLVVEKEINGDCRLQLQQEGQIADVIEAERPLVCSKSRDHVSLTASLKLALDHMLQTSGNFDFTAVFG